MFFLEVPLFLGGIIENNVFFLRIPPKIFGDVTEKILLGNFISALFYIKVMSGLYLLRVISVSICLDLLRSYYGDDTELLRRSYGVVTEIVWT